MDLLFNPFYVNIMSNLTSGLDARMLGCHEISYNALRGEREEARPAGESSR